MDKDWLIERLTREQAEAENLVRNDRLGPDPVPFGFMNSEWQNLLTQMKAGDELWFFSSPGHFWENLAGRQGYCLVRAGRVVSQLVTRMN
ncbi:MAG: hypothetical protein F9K44_09055 [Hyphomicrobiaceae bacterium]|nr:MAG: hypothetical protein F9K44_09055 [Hyphomicrobiaceae bacterium]